MFNIETVGAALNVLIAAEAGSVAGYFWQKITHRLDVGTLERRSQFLKQFRELDIAEKGISTYINFVPDYFIHTEDNLNISEQPNHGLPDRSVVLTLKNSLSQHDGNTVSEILFIRLEREIVSYKI